MQKIKKIRRFAALSLCTVFLLTSAFSSVESISLKETKFRFINTESSDSVSVYLGSMTMEYNDDADENYVKITFDTIDGIDEDFEIGQRIRLNADWKIVEGGIRQDYWNFSIYSVSIGSYSIKPENHEWYKEVYDRYAKDDSSEGFIYFDFTPTREFFTPAWHKNENVAIRLRCQYKNKGWLEPEEKWQETKEIRTIRGTFEYANTPPSITGYSIVKEGKGKITLIMNVSDPDFRPSSGLGDYIGVAIDWGDTSRTDTGYWDNKDQIVNGKTVVSKSHTYQSSGTYTIKAQVKDWYNAGFHDYSREITIEVGVKSKSFNFFNLNLFLEFANNFVSFEKFEKIINNFF